MRTQRRLASELLKCGSDRIWFDPEHKDDIARAITREDVRRLIRKGFIKKKQIKGVSRARANVLAEKKKKGRRQGHGKRKGTSNARLPRKKKWILKIRSQRKFLRELKKEGTLSGMYRKLYLMAKGGVFRSKAHLKLILNQLKGGRSE